MVRTGFGLILKRAPDIEVVAEAGDGVEAVAEAHRVRPDVALMDIRMPKMDGLTALERISSFVNVVVVTTFDQDEYVYKALRGGACGFILKDAGPGLLVEAIRSAGTGDALVSPSITVRLLRQLSRPAPPPDHRLSARELDVVKLAAVGNTNAEIAAALHLSIGTVKTHLANVQGKLGARNRVEIAAWAWTHGVVGRK
ncbi:response regulator transcription factor [Amycolatopsis carbonis]|uniref:Response regulator transcription factor n=1 Tax=Amycolatopsis carbonis TaxID=715471 RepID=A0A9Y2IR55_9PSEU|nr:response regulator transcription factor [Amycolatopsis sp. 2-15]WIX83959.1 response regulator transcription factor [Amycolatopsis sp. 2-15]